MTASGLGNSAFPQSTTFSLSSAWSQLRLGLRPPWPRTASASVLPRLQLPLALSQLSEALEALQVFSRALRRASSLVFSPLGSRRPDLNKLQAPELPIPASSRVLGPGLLPRLQLLLGPSRRKLPSSPSFAQAPELPVPASSRVRAPGLLPRLQLLLVPSRRKLSSSPSFARTPLPELPSAFPYSLGPQPLLATRRRPLLLGFVRSRTPASPRHSASAAPSASALYGLSCFIRTCSASASTPIQPRLFPSDLLGLSAQHRAPLGFSPRPT